MLFLSLSSSTISAHSIFFTFSAVFGLLVLIYISLITFIHLVFFPIPLSVLQNWVSPVLPYTFVSFSSHPHSHFAPTLPLCFSLRHPSCLFSQSFTLPSFFFHAPFSLPPPSPFHTVPSPITPLFCPSFGATLHFLLTPSIPCTLHSHLVSLGPLASDKVISNLIYHYYSIPPSDSVSFLVLFSAPGSSSPSPGCGFKRGLL